MNEHRDGTRYQIDVDVDEPFSQRVDVEAVVEAVMAALRWHGHENAAVGVLITDDSQAQSLNRRYRGVDAPTDVLSFSQQEGAEAEPGLQGLPDELAQELNRNLGDLVMAFPYLERQADRYHSTVRAELRLLAVHGTLHLLGYDHATDEEKADMWKVQDNILVLLGEQTHADREHD